VNVDRHWLGTSIRRVRVYTAGLTLFVAGFVVLGLGSRSAHVAAKVIDQIAEGQFSGDQITPYPVMGMANPPQRATSVAPSPIQARSIVAGLPLRFEPNQGQANLDPTDGRARFVSRGPGYSLFLGSQGAILRLLTHNSSNRAVSGSATQVESLQMKLAGANPDSTVGGEDILPGKTNYLIGNNPAKWRRAVPQFAAVRYSQVYPGIDLIFYGHEGRLEYDFQVAPGSDPAMAELEFDGAQQLEVKDGALVIRTRANSLRLEAPRAYQRIDGRQQPIQARFVLRGRRAGFAVGAYDHSRALVIDPVLTFSTYFGGSGNELASSVAVDGSSNIYLTGSTTSPDLLTLYPVSGILQSKLVGTQNVYIAKITPPQGTTSAVLDYVTYLGGNGTDSPAGIAVDGAGDAYVAGTTTSSNFPYTLTAYQTVPESVGKQHVFVTELDPFAANLLYSSYLSGNGTDVATGMTIDAKGFIYVTGTTTSVETLTTDQFPASNLPQALPFQSIPRYSTQFFVTKVNTNAQSYGSIAYSTYFGGGDFVPPLAIAGGGIAVDTNGNVYFTGTTNFTYSGTSPTTDFPILNAYQPCLDQVPPTIITGTPTCSSTSSTANSDAFVTKLNPNAEQGTQLLWSTYLGGSQTDTGTGIALDSGAANVYVTGSTNSQDFTASTFASFQQCLNNLPPTVTTGTTTCTTQTNPAYDAYVARLSNPAPSTTTTTTTTTATNVSLTYFSYLGGSADEAGLAITVDSASGAVVTGWTQSAANFLLQNGTYVQQPGTFPVAPYPSAIQGTLVPTQDAFLARINTAAVTGQNETASWASYFGGTGMGQGTSVALDSNEVAYFAGDTNAPDLQTLSRLVKPLQSKNNGGYDAFVAQVGGASTLSLAGVLTLGTNQTYINAGNQATFTYTLTNGGPDLATSITVTDDLSPSVTGVPLTFVSASASPTGTCSGGSTTTNVTCNIQSLQSGNTATITIVVTPTPTGGEAKFNGGAVQATATNGVTTPVTFVPAEMSDFSLSVSPVNVTIPAAGDSATYQVQVTPLPIYNTGISLSVSGLPTGATSSFTSPTVTLPSTSPGTSTLNISTTARPITTASASPAGRSFYAIWLSVPGLALVGIGLGGTRRQRRVTGMLLAALLFSILPLLPACSHKSTTPPVSGTPAGTYTLTVTATSGSDTKSQTIQLVVP
jgi:uncharacterized repeat protein (TIGR01451 family)